MKNWMTANGAAFGFNPGEVTDFATKLTDLTTKLASKHSADTAAVTANEALETSEDAAEAIWRSASKRLQPNPTFTDAMRSDAGLTIPDRIRTKREVGADVPGVEVKLTTGGVFIHWGTDPTNELQNGKPVWADGANIYLSIDAGAQFLAAFDRSSPYFYGLTGAAIKLTVQVAYRTPEEDGVGVKSAPQTVSTGG